MPTEMNLPTESKPQRGALVGGAGEIPPRTNSDEWYTPPEIFETLGLTFDIDVCAPEGGIAWIPASKHYTIDDNALEQPWTGRVWMNPPFSNPGPFVHRWIAHGNGVAFVPFSKSRWYEALWNSAASFALPDIHLKFVRQQQRKGIFLPMVLVAIGPIENHNAIAKLGKLRS
jgi:hypothetical protein